MGGRDLIRRPFKSQVKGNKGLGKDSMWKCSRYELVFTGLELDTCRRVKERSKREYGGAFCSRKFCIRLCILGLKLVECGND